MHGLVMKTDDLDYSDLSRYGRVTIEYGSAGARVTVDGFAFGDSATCRQHIAKAMAWARDVLAVEVESVRLIPGGQLSSATELDQFGLDEERRGVDNGRPDLSRCIKY